MICTTSSHIIWKEDTCIPGASLVVQWLRLHTLNTRVLDLILGQETRSCMLQLRPSTDKKKKKACIPSIPLLQAGIWWVSGKLASVNHVDENNTPEERSTVRLKKLESVDNYKGQKNDDSPRWFTSELTCEREGDSCPIWVTLFWGLLFQQPS